MQILTPVVLDGSGWFWMVPVNLEGPMGLRRVPYDPETFPSPPQLQSGIGKGPFGRLGESTSQIRHKAGHRQSTP